MTENGRLLLSTKRAVTHIKRSRFIKEQEAGELLSSLGIKIPLIQISLVVSILF